MVLSLMGSAEDKIIEEPNKNKVFLEDLHENDLDNLTLMDVYHECFCR